MDEQPRSIKVEIIEDPRESAQKRRQEEEQRLEEQRRDSLQARLAKLKATRETLTQLRRGSDRQQEVKQRIPQECLRAHLLQQEVQAATVAAQRAVAARHAEPKSTAPPLDHPANMNRDLSLDSLIVKILGKIWEPTISTQEVRDLAVLLPAAVHSERAAHETKIADLEEKTSGSSVSRRLDDSEAQKEIHSLKSINGALRSDVQRLQQQLKSQNAIPNLQNEINRLKTINGTLKNGIKKLEDTIKQSHASNLQAGALKEVNNIKSIHGGVGAEIKKLEQAFKDRKTATKINRTTGGNSEVTSYEPNQNPGVDMQSQIQAGNMPPTAPRARPQPVSSAPGIPPPGRTLRSNSTTAHQTTGSMPQSPSWNAANLPAPSFQQGPFLPTAATPQLPSWGSGYLSMLSNTPANQTTDSKPQVPSWNTENFAPIQQSPSLAAGRFAAAGSTTTASLPVNGNSQSQLSTLHGLQSRDPRTQLYAASPAGMFFQPSGSADAMGTLKQVQTNATPIIHPSRLAQVDEIVRSSAADPRLIGRANTKGDTTSVATPSTQVNQTSVASAAHGLPSGNSSSQSHPMVINEDWTGRYSGTLVNTTAPATNPTEDPRLAGRSTTMTSNEKTISASVNATVQPQLQTADHSTISDSGILSYAPFSATSVFPNEPWKPTFNGSYRTVPSLGLVVSSPVSGGSPKSSDSELDSTAPVFGKKRAASLPIEGEVAKKTKVQGTEDEVVHKSLTSLDDDIEQLEARYIQAKQRLAAPPGTDVNIAIPNPIARPVSADAAVQAKPHERRDSAIATAAFFNPPLDGRQPTCMHCRFANLDCNHQSPCQNCDENENSCVYWQCEYGGECTAPNCWYSHEPAAEDIAELLPGTAA